MNSMMLTSQHIQCPYCWETIEIVIDPSEPHQTYVEDCYVCCRPIVLDVSISSEEEVEVIAFAENE